MTGSRVEDREPFGVPDGSIGDLDDLEGDFVHLPERFGGVALQPSNARIRVLAGRLGAGKSLYIRRMQNYQFQRNRPGSFSVQPSRNLASLSSSDLALFNKRANARGANSEHWKMLWRRAIARSAASYLLLHPELKTHVKTEARDQLDEFRHLLAPQRHPRSIVEAAKEVMLDNTTTNLIDRYLNHKDWVDVEHVLASILRSAPPIFLYIDAIDDNFRWAPSLWSNCQRGLFYAVMDMLRDSQLNRGLHVVIAIRDITLSSIRASEHAGRYLDYTHIGILDWNRASICEFLHRKLAALADSYFQNPGDRSLESWLGFSTIRNDVRGIDEDVEDYLIRHTRLVPRDIVTLGNELCRFISGHSREELTVAQFRRIVAQNSRRATESQIALCANQAISDAMPSEAVDYDFANIYLQPSEYMLREAQGHVVTSIETTQTEVFNSDALAQMETCSSTLFRHATRLGDILWQQGLLGVLEGGHARFFSLTHEHTSLPRNVRKSEYVWNPLMFDVIKSVAPTLPAPMWPE